MFHIFFFRQQIFLNSLLNCSPGKISPILSCHHLPVHPSISNSGTLCGQCISVPGAHLLASVASINSSSKFWNYLIRNWAPVFNSKICNTLSWHQLYGFHLLLLSDIAQYIACSCRNNLR